MLGITVIESIGNLAKAIFDLHERIWIDVRLRPCRVVPIDY